MLNLNFQNGTQPPLNARNMNAIVESINALGYAVGGPNVASTVSAMTDTSKVYVYTGSETGYTAGNWYYYNGSAWVSGGVYQATAVETDTTLTMPGEPADAKVTGDEIDGLKSDLDTKLGYIKALTTDDDLNDYDETGVYAYTNMNRPLNAPDYNESCVAYTVHGWDRPGFAVQYVVTALTNTLLYRYRTTTAWSDWDVIAKISDLDTLSEYNAYNTLLGVSGDDGTNNGVTFTWGSVNSSVNIVGTATNTAFRNLFFDYSAFPDGILAGETVWLKLSGNQNSGFRIGFYNGSSTISAETYTSDAQIDIPSNATGMYIRAQVENGITVNDTVHYALLNAPANQDLALLKKYGLIVYGNIPLPGGDLNDVTDRTGIFSLNSTSVYNNTPWSESRRVAGLLWVYMVPNATVQFAMNWTDCIIYFRRYLNGTWNSWKAIAGGGGGEITVEQIYNQYNVDNTVTAYPSITSDTNNYLAPTGDTTDVTANIVTMLENTGACHLGPGDYWVSGIDMPVDSAIIGSGPDTKVYLSGEDTDAGYAIKLNSRCSVSNLAIYGNTTDYSGGSNTNYPPDAELVQRHGILLQGSQSTDGKLPRRAMVSDVFIANFSGGGITCYDTGPGTAQGMNVSNVYIWHCYAGVYIPFNSEFGSYTNVKVTRCHYGCINNGGNNNFVNCQFIGNITNLWMDNSLGTSINNAHSSFSSCIFGHSQNNTGINILAQGIQYGELFTSCDIFYGSVNLENCTAFSFTGCSFGQAIPINITGGALTMFDSSTFRTAPVFNIANNAVTKVNSCFIWSGDQVTL